jgi:hypothetical protein
LGLGRPRRKLNPPKRFSAAGLDLSFFGIALPGRQRTSGVGSGARDCAQG